MGKITERLGLGGGKNRFEGGFISNVASTMIGILLTIGVGAWVQTRQDNRLAREMMFNVVKTVKDNGDGLAMIDSVCQDQQDALEYLFAYYQIYDGKLDSVSVDTLKKYYKRSFRITGFIFARSKTENYFYNAQTLHQFKNPEVYMKFAEFVENDRHIYGLVDELHDEAETVARDIAARMQIDRKTLAEALEEVIRDHSLYAYYRRVLHLKSKGFLDIYRDSFNDLLKQMDATQEEYDEFVKSMEKKEECYELGIRN